MIELDSHLFPVPESYYARGGFLDRYFSLSLWSLNLQITTVSSGNLLDSSGHYFFRNSSVPTPRACTVLAWDRIVRLGHYRSESFIVPFLPSLRDDDEMGQAIATHGKKLSSLSRRSQLHARNQETHLINWGSVYLGKLTKTPTLDNVLVGQTERSNVVESLILPRKDIAGESSQYRIRERMEFLASWGFVGISAECKRMGIPWVTRFLTQFLNQESAAAWAYEYVRARNLVVSDPESINADYKELVFEATQRTKSRESLKANDKTGVEKSSKSMGRFGTKELKF